jgi:hypothetical protein
MDGSQWLHLGLEPPRDASEGAAAGGPSGEQQRNRAQRTAAQGGPHRSAGRGQGQCGRGPGDVCGGTAAG